MSAALPLDLARRFGHLREMAQRFGTVASDKRQGRRPVYYLRFNIDGEIYKVRRVPVGRSWIRIGSNEDLARDILDEIRSDLRRGASPLQAIAPYLGESAEAVSFRRHWSAFVSKKEAEFEQGHLSRGRITELRAHEKRGHLEPLLDRSIHTLDFAALEDWQAWLFGRDLAPKSVRHLMADVGTCLRWLQRRGDLLSAPDLPLTKVPDHSPRIPSPEQQEALLAAIPWAKAGYFLARGYMGLRDEEAARANVGDYDFREIPESGFIRDQLAVRGKGHRVRIVPVDPDVARWVREHHDPRKLAAWPGMKDMPLFPNPDADPARNAEGRWTQASRRRVMLAAMKATGVNTRPNEALRHCFGTRVANRLLREGYTASDASRKIMAMMGHTSIDTSNRYIKLAAESLRDVLREG